MKRNISVSKVLNEGFNLYINNFIKLVFPMAVFSTFYSVGLEKITFFTTTYGPEFLESYITLGNVVSSIGHAYVECLIIRVISNSYYQRETDYSSVIQIPVKLFMGVFFLNLITQVAMVIGILLLVVPGIFVMLGWFIATVVYVNEEDESVMSSISRSWQLTLGNKGQIFLLILLIGILAIVIAFVMFSILSGGVFSLSAFTDGSYLDYISSPVYIILSTSLVAPISTVFCTVIYFNLLKLKENFEVSQLSSGFMDDSQTFETDFQ